MDVSSGRREQVGRGRPANMHLAHRQDAAHEHHRHTEKRTPRESRRSLSPHRKQEAAESDSCQENFGSKRHWTGDLHRGSEAGMTRRLQPILVNDGNSGWKP